VLREFKLRAGIVELTASGGAMVEPVLFFTAGVEIIRGIGEARIIAVRQPRQSIRTRDPQPEIRRLVALRFPIDLFQEVNRDPRIVCGVIGRLLVLAVAVKINDGRDY
jgi:hypothetical protein